MSLSGVLADFPVADVFQLIAQQRKTGVLEIERKGRTLLVYFLEGQVLSARPSETRPDGSLAGYLLRAGALSEAALAQARKRQEETLEPLVPTLIQLDLVARADLEQVTKLATNETANSPVTRTYCLRSRPTVRATAGIVLPGCAPSRVLGGCPQPPIVYLGAGAARARAPGPQLP